MDGLIEQVDPQRRHLQVRVHDVLKTFAVPPSCDVRTDFGATELKELRALDRVQIRCSTGPGPLRADTIRVYSRLRLVPKD
jgi:hypothetical protein